MSVRTLIGLLLALPSSALALDLAIGVGLHHDIKGGRNDAWADKELQRMHDKTFGTVRLGIAGQPHPSIRLWGGYTHISVIDRRDTGLDLIGLEAEFLIQIKP